VDNENTSHNLSALLIAYQRPQNTLKIIEDFFAFSDGKLYISLDYPKNATQEQIDNHSEISSLIFTFTELFPNRVIFRSSKVNLGCSLSVLSSLDWFFSTETEGIILEDDCLPSEDFYVFARRSLDAMKSPQLENVVLGCGTQFVPNNLIPTPGYLSKYILTWGWFTDRNSWLKIKNAMIFSEHLKLSFRQKFNIEHVYWRAGARRAYEGFVDVWDTILVNALQLNGLTSILPAVNLVKNVGFDEAALHTKDASLVNRPTEELIINNMLFQQNFIADKWLHDHLFKISARHFFTTRITKLLDLFFRKKKFNTGLISRWSSFNPTAFFISHTRI